MRGNIVTIDTPVWLFPEVGHLRDWDLAIESRVDGSSNFEALGLFGGYPEVPSRQPPSDLKIRVNCVRTARAVASNVGHAAAVRYFGGLFDSATVAIEISGEAKKGFELFGQVTAGFVMPRITETNFRTL